MPSARAATIAGSAVWTPACSRRDQPPAGPDGRPILSGPLLDPSGDWDPGDAVQVVQDDLALDSMSEAFQALTTDYRLCIPYLARVIRIDGDRLPTGERVTAVWTGVHGAPA